MGPFSRIVVGYHGCEERFAKELLLGKRPITDWQPSTNEWDWLGHGIYFWEHSPERALRWAREKYSGAGFARESHIQVVVRNPSCILGVFRPNIQT